MPRPLPTAMSPVATTSGCWPAFDLRFGAQTRKQTLQRGSLCSSCTSIDSCEVTCVESTEPGKKLDRDSASQPSPCLLDAVSKLLTDAKYNDVLFITRDGEVQANRAYLAARCSYFEALLYGPHKERSLTKIQLPHASSAALRHVLQYLHSGQLPSQERSWLILAEACSLSQQYLLPEVHAHAADCLVAQLTPANLGPCLSYSLQEGLDTVVKRIWLASPGLMRRPISFQSGYSAAAISFCLDHTCCQPAVRAAIDAGGGAGADVTNEAAVPSAPAAAEEAVYTAVLEWCQEAASGCEACCAASSAARAASGNDASSGAADRDDGSSCSAAASSRVPSSGPTGSSCRSSSTCCSNCRSGWCEKSAKEAACSSSSPTRHRAQRLHCDGPVLCGEHQTVLQAFLMRLNWQQMGPAAMDHVEKLQLLPPTALLTVYRAQANALHAALHGTFMLCDGVRLHMRQGYEVLECSSIQHVTIATTAPLTQGLHCWEVQCHVACSLTWVGVTDGTVHGSGWGGKQPGGFFYGCNDALCNASSSEQRSGATYCGHGPWGDGSVLHFFLDMGERELWISVDGAEPKLGFNGLPAAGVYPAVSVRAPAQLGFTFRPYSWSRGCDSC